MVNFHLLLKLTESWLQKQNRPSPLPDHRVLISKCSARSLFQGQVDSLALWQWEKRTQNSPRVKAPCLKIIWKVNHCQEKLLFLSHHAKVLQWEQEARSSSMGRKLNPDTGSRSWLSQSLLEVCEPVDLKTLVYSLSWGIPIVSTGYCKLLTWWYLLPAASLYLHQFDLAWSQGTLLTDCWLT